MPLFYPRSHTLLAKSAVAVGPHTGTATETILATVAVPARLMSTNGILRITSLWNYTSSANAKTCRIRLGGISGTAFLEAAITSGVTMHALTVLRNRNATNSQVGGQASGAMNGSSGSAIVTAAIDTTANQDLVFTAQLANTGESITLHAYEVELL